MSTSIIITAIICISAVSIPIGGLIQDYKVKKEKIRADAMVRAEDIKAKNQLEIEKLFISNNQRPSIKVPDYDDGIYRNSRVNKERL